MSKEIVSIEEKDIKKKPKAKKIVISIIMVLLLASNAVQYLMSNEIIGAKSQEKLKIENEVMVENKFKDYLFKFKEQNFTIKFQGNSNKENKKIDEVSGDYHIYKITTDKEPVLIRTVPIDVKFLKTGEKIELDRQTEDQIFDIIVYDLYVKEAEAIKKVEIETKGKDIKMSTGISNSSIIEKEIKSDFFINQKYTFKNMQNNQYDIIISK